MVKFQTKSQNVGGTKHEPQVSAHKPARPDSLTPKTIAYDHISTRQLNWRTSPTHCLISPTQTRGVCLIRLKPIFKRQINFYSPIQDLLLFFFSLCSFCYITKGSDFYFLFLFKMYTVYTKLKRIWFLILIFQILLCLINFLARVFECVVKREPVLSLCIQRKNSNYLCFKVTSLGKYIIVTKVTLYIFHYIFAWSNFKF